MKLTAAVDVNKDRHYFISRELASNNFGSIEWILHLLLGLAPSGAYMLTFRQSSLPAPPASPSVRHDNVKMDARVFITTALLTASSSLDAEVWIFG